MVERISRISRSDPTSPTDVGHTLNIGSDADNAWVAARQSQINHDIEARRQHAMEERRQHGSPLEDPGDDHTLTSRQETETDDGPEGEAEELRFSGESERIGTQNFDEDTPFGDRVAIV